MGYVNLIWAVSNLVSLHQFLPILWSLMLIPHVEKKVRPHENEEQVKLNLGRKRMDFQGP